MLMSGFSEGQDAAVISVGDTSPMGFRALLGYLYTDQLATEYASVVDVMRKAQEIELERLRLLCLAYCRRNIAPSNAVSWLVQADVHVSRQGARPSTARALPSSARARRRRALAHEPRSRAPPTAAHSLCASPPSAVAGAQ